ncbi:30S ribosomal protein S6 [Patescibacteria group bacterium]
MRKYEIGLLFDAGLDKKKLEKVLKEFENFIKKNKGQIVEKNQWKERKLAYSIKKADNGIYFFAHYELEADKNDALLKDLNLNTDILRYLITLPPKDTKLESKPVKAKSKKLKGKMQTKEEVKSESKKTKEKDEDKERSLPAGRQVSTPSPPAKSLEMTKKKEPVKVEEKIEEKEEKKVKDKKVEKKVEKIEEKKEVTKPRTEKTVEESKKAKAQEQKEKKVSEEKLDQEIDRILSDEDLL